MTQRYPVPQVMRWRAEAGLYATTLEAPPRLGFGRHTHDAVILTLVSSGAKRVTLKGEGRWVSPGQDVLLAPAGTAHGTESSEDGFVHHALILKPCCLDGIMTRNWGVSLDSLSPFLGPDPALAHAARQLHNAIVAGERCTTLQRDRSLYMLIAHLTHRNLPSRRTSKSSDGRPAMELVRSMIEARLEENLHLAELAHASGMSPLRLLRSFQRHYGLPPHMFQIQERIRRSCRMLQAGTALAQVATELGFVDQSHFTRHFRRLVGVPPGAYARAVRK